MTSYKFTGEDIFTGNFIFIDGFTFRGKYILVIFKVSKSSI